MPTILISVLFILFSIIIHLLLCRRDPDKTLKAKLFIIIALAAYGVFLGIACGARLPLILTASVIYVLLVPIYLIFYVSTELNSPSKKILHAVEAGGASYLDVLKALERENFILLRLEELEQSGCVARQRDRYALTSSGWSIARGLAIYQKLLGRDIGG